MRWRAPSERVQLIALSPILIPATALLLLVIGPMAAAAWISKKLFPPCDWHSWFAWRPVRCNDWWDDENYGQWFWLETVERWRGDLGQVAYRAQKKPA